jgi:hypothetical protein
MVKKRLWRVGPLEVGRPITVTVATTMASGMLEPVPAGGRPNDRDPLALAQGGGRGGRTPGALERWQQLQEFAFVVEEVNQGEGHPGIGGCIPMHGPPPSVGNQERLMGLARGASEQVTCRDDMDSRKGAQLAFNKLVEPLKVVKKLVGKVWNKPVDAVRHHSTAAQV